MNFRLCNNEKAVLISREPEIVKKSLYIFFDGFEDGHTAVIGAGDNKFYRPIKSGSCELHRDSLAPGVITVAVASDEDMKIRYACDELFCVVSGDMTVVTPNFYEYDKIISEVRAECDDLRERNADFEARLIRFEEEFERIYAGYRVL